MAVVRGPLLKSASALSLILAIGCATGREIDTPPPLQSSDPSCESPRPKVSRPLSVVVQASAEIPAPIPVKELSEATLVQEVLRRNPTVDQMAAAAQAAMSRVSQVTSLDDPKAGAFVGPASIGSRSVDFAYRFEVSQAIPFPGKLSLRGDGARGEAAAAGADLEDARLALAEAARIAFADYSLAFRAIEVNQESLKLLGEFRENAATRYRTGVGEQQDVYQAEVAIARQRERASTLERLQRVAQARINTLLNLPPDAVLAPPPKDFEKSASLPQASELRELAVQNRPDVAALRARATADEAAIALANKEYYPDFEAMASYDAFWQTPEKDLRPMVGVRMNLPVRTSRRDGALAEAQARLAPKSRTGRLTQESETGAGGLRTG